MPTTPARPGTGEKESNLTEVDGVPVYGRKDDQGRPTKIDAIDQDEAKILRMADRLQRLGFGVMRQRNPRAGKVFYTLNAVWAGTGAPPRDPFDRTPNPDGR